MKKMKMEKMINRMTEWFDLHIRRNLKQPEFYENVEFLQGKPNYLISAKIPWKTITYCSGLAHYLNDTSKIVNEIVKRFGRAALIEGSLDAIKVESKTLGFNITIYRDKAIDLFAVRAITDNEAIGFFSLGEDYFCSERLNPEVVKNLIESYKETFGLEYNRLKVDEWKAKSKN